MPIKQTALEVNNKICLEVVPNNDVVILGMYFCNPTNVDGVINMYISKTMDISNVNKIFHSIPVIANSTKVLNSNEKIFLSNGDKIICNCNIDNTVYLTITYTEGVR